MKFLKAVLLIVAVLMLVACSNEIDKSLEEDIVLVADGKNLSELTTEAGKVYTISLSKGSSFTIGGDNEESMYSFVPVSTAALKKIDNQAQS